MNPGSDLEPSQPLELVIGMTGKESLTAETVARVRNSGSNTPNVMKLSSTKSAHLPNPRAPRYKGGQLQELGELMNLCHGYLNALQLSTPKLRLGSHSPQQWRCGAKLTGGGGGGSMVTVPR